MGTRIQVGGAMNMATSRLEIRSAELEEGALEASSLIIH